MECRRVSPFILALVLTGLRFLFPGSGTYGQIVQGHLTDARTGFAVGQVDVELRDTVGMVVDANVIIYERIREELKDGKSPRAAVDAGYKRAFWTIFDAQITTFIAGVVMLEYGTGAIKGFAVTLLIGIVTSMFSAIFLSRILFDWMTRRRADHLSI